MPGTDRNASRKPGGSGRRLPSPQVPSRYPPPSAVGPPPPRYHRQAVAFAGRGASGTGLAPSRVMTGDLRQSRKRDDFRENADGRSVSTKPIIRPLCRPRLPAGTLWRDSPSGAGHQPGTSRGRTARATRERRRIGDTLVAMGAATATDVLQAVAVQQEIAFLSAEELPSTPPWSRAVSQDLRQYLACPIAVDGATITVATAEPTNPLLLDDLRQTLGMSIRLLRGPGRVDPRGDRRGLRRNTALQKIVEGMGSSPDRDAAPGGRRQSPPRLAFELRWCAWSTSWSRRRSPPTRRHHIEPFEDSLRVRLPHRRAAL